MQTERNKIDPLLYSDKSRIVNLEKGKLPPQALDFEEAILGALMIDKQAEEIFDVITDADVFYKDAHKEIFKAAFSLTKNNSPIDLLTMSAELKKMGKLEYVGGDYALIQLTQKISSSAHIEYHARIVLQKFMQREAIKLCSMVIEQAYDETIDVFDMLDVAEMGFSNISDKSTTGQKIMDWGQLLDRVVKNVEMLTTHGDKVLGTPTGFWKLDAHFGGWQATDLVIIGARSGMGKTAFTVGSMIGTAKQKHAVGYLSMEMSGVQLATRGISVNSNYHLNQLLRNGFEKQEYFTGLINLVNDMRTYPIHIDDTPALTLLDIRRRVRKMVRQHDVKVVFLDYVQLAAGSDRDLRLRIVELCYGLKALAKELNITIVALSQLDKSIDKRSPEPRPVIGDLSESSAIENAADIVGLLYRPAKYGREPLYKSQGGELNEGENTEFIVAKFRNGGVGTIGLWYDANRTKFMDEEPHRSHTADESTQPKENPNWEAQALSRTALPTAEEAFGPRETSTNDADDDDGPF